MQVQWSSAMRTVFEEETPMSLRDCALAGTRRERRACRVRRSSARLRKSSDFYRKLDLVLARLEHIEQRLDQQGNSDKSDAAVRSRSALSAKPRLLALHPQTRGIVKLNHQTGCFEYYGKCSNISLSNQIMISLRANVNFPDCVRAWGKIRGPR